MVSNDSLSTGFNPFFYLYEESCKSQAQTAQSSQAMSLNNGGAPTLTDFADMLRPIDLAYISLH